MKERLQILSVFLLATILWILFIPVSTFALDAPGQEEIIYQGLKKVSKGIKESLKPENRQRQRQQIYHEHLSSYSPTESAKGGDYWQTKNERDRQLFEDAYITDHHDDDARAYKTYKNIDRVIIGPVWKQED